MAKGIYLIQSGDILLEMREERYESEDLLQRLIAQHPHVLAGDEMSRNEPRRWLLIRREMDVPAEDTGIGRWSLDHLFIDQDGVPTLVEVKRSSDTRIRREVVGQMFDYAANAVVYWPLATIRAEFESRSEDADEQLRDLLGADADAEHFWETVGTNLRAGRIRLVFVADEIPAELRRIVEFLNGQMNPAEVLALEIRQFIGSQDGNIVRTLVPTVIGQTVEAEQKKSSSGRGAAWTEDRFFATLGACFPSDVAVARDLFAFGAAVTGRPIEWGSGKTRGSFTARLVSAGRRFSLFSVYTSGECGVNFGWNKLVKDRPDVFEKYRAETNEKLQTNFDELTWGSGWPVMTLSDLAGQKLGDFKALVEQFAAEAKQLS